MNQLVSTLRCMRLVRRPIPDDPVAVLPCKVRNSSKLTGSAPLLEICIEKGGVADFVEGVAGDVLRAIGIEVREGSLIGVQRLVRDLPQWVDYRRYRPVPHIVSKGRIRSVGRGQKLQDGDISLVQTASLAKRRFGTTHQTRLYRGCTSSQHSSFQKITVILPDD